MSIFEIDEFTKWKILSKDISTQEEAEKYVKEKFGDNIRAYGFLELIGMIDELSKGGFKK